LLATAHGTSELVTPLAEPGEERERSVQPRGPFWLGKEPATQLEILQHRHAWKEMAPLGDQDQLGAHGRRGRARRQHSAVERRPSFARQQAGERLEERALPFSAPYEDVRLKGK